MSKLNDLIKELCPDGVEFVALGDIGTFYGGITGKSKIDFENGNAKFITYKNVYSNMTVDLTTSDKVKISENEKQRTLEYGDVCFTGSSETPDECGFSSVVVEQPKEPVYLNSFCFFFRLNDKTILNPHFLKYVFRSHDLRIQIVKTASGVTRFNVSKKLMEKVKIPVPPLPVQREIVRILDNFTELTAELQKHLEAEFTARKKQYEYYRDTLLSFDVLGGGTTECKWRTLGEVAEVTDYVANGSFASLRENVTYKHNPDYAVLIRTVDFSTKFDRKQMIYIDEKAYNFLKKSQLFGGEIIINNIGAGVGNSFLCPNLEVKMSLAPNSVMLKTSNNKFYFYWLNSKYGKNALSKIISKSAMPKFNKTGLRNIKIPVPPIEEQERIVKMLDRFYSLCNDISEGLPAEIEARQKQYEYYRDKLLNFEEVK